MLPWNDIYNAFSPFLPVPPEKLDDWYVPRPDRPLQKLIERLSPKNLPQKHILIGQPASGKSTELTKLAADLDKNRYALVIRFDLDQNLDIEKANPIDIIFLMGAAIYKAAEGAAASAGSPLDKSLLDALGDELKTLVTTHTEHRGRGMDWGSLVNGALSGIIVFAGATLLGPVGAVGAVGVTDAAQKGASQDQSKRPSSAFSRALSPFRFSSGIDRSIVRKQEVEPSVAKMIAALNKIIDDVTIKANRSPILLIDGLDKLRTPESIEANFLNNKFLPGPQCHALYAAPLDLYYGDEFVGIRNVFHVHPFPHIKLHEPGNPDAPVEKNRQFLRDVVHRRLQSLKLDPQTVIDDDALEALITGSGGVMRDFIRLFQSAALNAQVEERPRIIREDARQALNELRRQFQAIVTPRLRQILDEVRQTGRRIDSDDCDALLRNGIVLSYADDDNLWYGVHAVLTNASW
jgi:hypothetical protein